MLLHILIAALLLWPVGAMAADAPKEKTPVVDIDRDPLEDEPPPQNNSLILQGFNKVPGHISRLEGPVGTSMRFGNLDIVARRCWKSSPEERPENAALLEVSEL